MHDDERLFLWACAQATESFDAPAYRAWLACGPTQDPQADPGRSFASPPLVSLIIVDDGDASALRRTIESIGGGGAAVELLVSGRSVEDLQAALKGFADGFPVAVDQDGAAGQAAALMMARGIFIGFVFAGDRLPAGTLPSLERLLSQAINIDVLYTDEDWFDEDGRSLPRFKPAWDPEAHMGFDLFGRLCLMRGSLVRAVGGLRATTAPAHHYDLHLRVSAASRASSIYHVPRVCYSRRKPGHVPPGGEDAALANYAAGARAAAAEAASLCFGRPTAVRPAGAAPFINRVLWPLPDVAPLVSVIIPTRDHSDILETCVTGVLKGTDYQNLEVVIVDNGSSERETRALFDTLRSDPRVQIVRDDGPFNFSRLINLGARHARGSVLALLNNDVEVVAPAWLSDLVALASRYEIGCVGAKLLYGTGEIQHAGIVLQQGPLAMHVFRLCGRDDLGYDNQPVSTRAYLAVTAACMVVQRHLFDRVGGFDERFAVAFNDVDFCLKIADLGYLNVCSPHEPLLHHEGLSRGSDTSVEHRARFAKELALLDSRWSDRIRADPFGNPNIAWDWNAGFRLSGRPQSHSMR